MLKEEIKALILKAKKPENPPALATTPKEPREKTSEEIVLEKYHYFLDIFVKPVAGQLPLHYEWDLKVQLIPNAPSLIFCTLYLLSCAEQVFQNKYIQENLDHSFICESNLPYSTPVFYNKKKDGSFQPLFNYRKINAITIKDVSPLPCITTILEDTIGVVLFSKFDL